ncbi:MAG: Cys-Gln thioester bond-forming surface protein [Lachnospiraceae bacterium]|nr:Cys-Gln thioester bond-forming surface protein [Lachnospiraceae bacterium]
MKRQRTKAASLLMVVLLILSEVFRFGPETAKADTTPSGFSSEVPKTYYIGASLRPGIYKGDGYLHNPGAAAIIDMFYSYQSESGVDCTSFLPEAWAEVIRGKKKLASSDQVPNTDALGAFWEASRIRQEDGIAPDAANVTAFARKLKEFVSKSSNLYIEGAEKYKRYYGVTKGADELANIYRAVNDKDIVGYCTQLNYGLPGSGTSSFSAASLKSSLGITDTQYKGLVNMLKYGYPRNTGLQGTAYENFPEEALRQGTQFALWVYLAGTKGNNNDGAEVFEKLCTEDTLVNLTSYDVKGYVRYLLSAKDREAAPSVSVAMGAFSLNGSRLESVITVKGSMANGGIRLSFSGLPSGSLLDKKTAETTVLSGFNTEKETVKTLTLSIPSKNNAKKTVAVMAAALSSWTSQNVDLSYVRSAKAGEQAVAWAYETVKNYDKVSEAGSSRETPSPELKLIKKDGNGKALAGAVFELFSGSTSLGKKTTGSDGSALWPGLNFGASYTLKETAAPSGYSIPDEWKKGKTVTVREDSLLTTAEAVNTRVSSVIVKKTDEEGNVLAGVSFNLRYGDQDHTAATGKDGTAVWENIPVGTSCVIYETAVPEGYVMDEAYRKGKTITVKEAESSNTFTVVNERCGSILIKKTDRNTGKAVSGGVYGIFTDKACKVPAADVNGKKQENLKTGDDGTVKSGMLKVGTYYLKETAVQASGYALDPTVYEVKVKGGSSALFVEAAVSEERQRVRLKLQKTDAGKSDAEKTDAEKTDAGQSDAEKTDGKMTDAGKEQASSVSLKGAVFELALQSDVTDIPTGEVIRAGTVVGSYTTDEDGRITAEVMTEGSYKDHPLPNGKYIFRERKAPAGFTVNTGTFPVEASWDKTGAAVVEAAETIVPETPVRALFIKCDDGAEKKNVPGAVLGLFAIDKEGRISEEPSYTWTTGTEDQTLHDETGLYGHLIAYLVPGSRFMLREISTPAGYVTAEERKIEIRDTQDLQVFFMEDPEIHVEISKLSEETLELIPGAVFEILTKDGRPMAGEDGTPLSWTSGEVPEVIRKLPAGNYYLREKEAPFGYFLQDLMPFTVTDTREVQAFTMMDKKIIPSYEIMKHRLSQAPQKGDENGFGFRHGDAVNYEVILRNTGNIALTMSLTDVYEEAAEGCFGTPRISSVSGEGARWLNPDDKEAPARIRIEPGCQASVFLFTVVSDAAWEYLADDPADDKTVLNDGYLNTASVFDVEAEYTVSLQVPGEEGLESAERTIVFTEKDFPEELAAQEDTANTPVQLVSDYEITKNRLTEAPEAFTKGFYGFRPRETVSYEVTVQNTGDTVLTMTVEDVFEEAAKAAFSEPVVRSVLGEAAEWLNEEASRDQTVSPEIRLQPKAEAVILFEAEVQDSASSYLASHSIDDKEDDEDGYLNTARARRVKATYEAFRPSEDPEEKTEKKTEETELPEKEDTANTPVQEIRPGYTIEKLRVTDAPLKTAETAEEEKKEAGKASSPAYGFRSGDTVLYEIRVKNTGNIRLTLSVSDAFEKQSCFENLTWESVSGEGTLWLNEKAAKGGKEDPKIAVDPGCSALLLVSAAVSEEAEEYLAPSARDIKSDDKDGYLNTARAYNVSGTYTCTVRDPETGEEKQEEILLNEENCPELKEKQDTANTPVQEISPGYEMKKVRLTEAHQKPGTDRYGFFEGDTVRFLASVTNTGNIPLSLTVSDVFSKEAAAYFSGLKVISVTGAGVTRLDQDTALKNSVRIRLETGCTAEILFEAVVGEDVPEYTAPSAGDRKEDPEDGYLNTVTVTSVTGEIPLIRKSTAHSGETVTVLRMVSEKDYPSLAPRSDTANTPVQVLVPGYTLEKVRITEAPVKEIEKTETSKSEEETTGEAKVGEKTAASYGFRRGDTVLYEIRVKNTGGVTLDLSVSDTFENQDHFENPVWKSVSGKGTVWLNDKAAKDGKENPRIRIDPGCTAVLSVSAKVSAEAEEYLAPSAKDNKQDDKDGYLNIAKAYNAAGTFSYTAADPETGKEIRKEILLTEEKYPELKEKQDSANTPVQVTETEITPVYDPDPPKKEEPKKSPDVVLGAASDRGLYLALSGATFATAAFSLIVLLRKRRKKGGKTA